MKNTRKPSQRNAKSVKRASASSLLPGRRKSHSPKGAITILLVAVGLVGAFVLVSRSRAAACPALPTDKGTVTSTVNVPAAGTYRAWVRIMAPDSANNSVHMDVGEANCGVVVGDSGTTANQWVWVSHRNGSTSNRMDLALVQGTQAIKFAGREAGVKLDRVILTSDLACTPTGTGNNCTPVADTTAPTAALTAPAANATVSGTAVVTSATAIDNTGGSGVKHVEFLVNGAVVNTDTSSPYSYNWNSTTVANGSRTIAARAVDNQNNQSTLSSRTVTVNNTVAPKPGDCDGNGLVNAVDLSTVISNFSRTSATRAQGDLNADGTVNALDLSQVLSNYGS